MKNSVDDVNFQGTWMRQYQYISIVLGVAINTYSAHGIQIGVGKGNTWLFHNIHVVTSANYQWYPDPRALPEEWVQARKFEVVELRAEMQRKEEAMQTMVILLDGLVEVVTLHQQKQINH
ncbi:hypothetical protein ACH5RR_029290 [Cinchona calisaya]|uniref:Uncharacterized protein n=1 Tax=Cinchona calisaya TaxID=153742 RepID=A0ABD2YUM8_9GENT